MGREMRRVPPNWQHPEVSRFRFPDGTRQVYLPLLPVRYLKRSIKEYVDGCRKAQEVLQPPEELGHNYMPEWTPEEATHYMMYENTSEGTPISPAFGTPEELAHWLASTEASMFADIPGTYHQWLEIAKGSKESVGLMIQGESCEPAIV